MGRIADVERLKLRANFWNGLAVSFIVGGVVSPFFAYYNGDFSKLHIGSFLGLIAGVSAGLLCRWIAEATINEIQG